MKQKPIPQSTESRIIYLTIRVAEEDLTRLVAIGKKEGITWRAVVKKAYRKELEDTGRAQQ